MSLIPANVNRFSDMPPSIVSCRLNTKDSSPGTWDIHKRRRKAIRRVSYHKSAARTSILETPIHVMAQGEIDLDINVAKDARECIVAVAKLLGDAGGIEDLDVSAVPLSSERSTVYLLVITHSLDESLARAVRQNLQFMIESKHPQGECSCWPDWCTSEVPSSNQEAIR